MAFSVLGGKGWRRIVSGNLINISDYIWIYTAYNRDCDWKKDKAESIDCVCEVEF